jgi:hypothetical protein
MNPEICDILLLKWIFGFLTPLTDQTVGDYPTSDTGFGMEPVTC